MLRTLCWRCTVRGHGYKTATPFLILDVVGVHYLCTLHKSIPTAGSLGFAIQKPRKLILKRSASMLLSLIIKYLIAFRKDIFFLRCSRSCLSPGSFSCKTWRLLLQILAHSKWKHPMTEYYPLRCLRCVTLLNLSIIFGVKLWHG